MLFFAQLFIFSMIEMKNVSLKENENVVVTGWWWRGIRNSTLIVLPVISLIISCLKNGHDGCDLCGGASFDLDLALRQRHARVRFSNQNLTPQRIGDFQNHRVGRWGRVTL